MHFKLQEDKGQFGNTHIRWTLLFNVLVLTISFLPIWMAFLTSHVHCINAGVLSIICLFQLIIACNAIKNYRKLGIFPQPSLQGLHAARNRKFIHGVILTCFHDPMNVIYKNLSSIALQKNRKDIIVVVSFESNTPNLKLKKETMENDFKNIFGDFLTTVHYIDRSNELPGACSNKNHGLTALLNHLNQNSIYFASRSVTLTTCDGDNIFHPQYFEALEACYNVSNPILKGPVQMCVYQSPLFYNYKLDERFFFARVTGILRSFYMIGGLIPFSLNPMSTFSYPIELGLKAGFINPRYGLDDIVAKVKYMCATSSQVPIIMLPVPTISGPTSGTSFITELYEWSRQIRRWMVGSSEVFHYFIVHYRGSPLLKGNIWIFIFFIYYGLIFCASGCFLFLSNFKFNASMDPMIKNVKYISPISIRLVTQEETYTIDFVTQAPLIALSIQYFVFLCAFIMDSYVVKFMTIKEKISWFRNVLHFLISGPTMLMYSFISIYSLFVFSFQGKAMAKHDAASKEGIATTTNTNTAIINNNTNSISISTTSLLDENGDDVEGPSYISVSLWHGKVGFGSGYSLDVEELI